MCSIQLRPDAEPAALLASLYRTAGRSCHSIVIHGRVVADLLVGHLGHGAPVAPGPGLVVALVLDLALQHDVLGEVAHALAAGDGDGEAVGAVEVAGDALDAGDADDGLLHEARVGGAAAGRGLVADAEVGDARVQQGAVVAHERPLGAQAGRARVDDLGERLVRLGDADAAQRVLVARRERLRHLRVQHLGRRHAVALARAEPRPPHAAPLVRRPNVHAQPPLQRHRAVLDYEPRQLRRRHRRERELPYRRRDDGVCLAARDTMRQLSLSGVA